MRFAVLVAAALAILPAQTFGQREHIAMILLMPLLALWTSRLAEVEQRILPVLAAGLGGGLALTIKPHFALGLAPAFITLLVYTRSWRLIFALENRIAGAVAAIYGASVVVFYPTFVSDIVPMAMAIYLPIRQSLLVMLVPLLLAAAQLWLAASWRPGLFNLPAIVMLSAAACGFFLVLVLQGKGWPYHSYPTLVFVYIILAVALSSRELPESRPRMEKAVLAGTAAVACVTFCWFNLAVSLTMLNEPIRKLAVNPRLAIISPEIAVGHPLVRQVGGTWVMRGPGLGAAAAVIKRTRQGALDSDTAKRLAVYAERDRAGLVEDIRQNRPDIIVIDRTAFDWEAWARADPALAEQLAAYRTAASLDGYAILHRGKD